jgi:hypothetical protein
MVGHRATIGTCPTAGSTQPTEPPPDVATKALPFTSSTTTTTKPPAVITAAVTDSPAKVAELPFTGVDVKLLGSVGATLVLLGLWILTTLEQRRRAIRRAAAAVQTSPVAEGATRASRWFLGL